MKLDKQQLGPILRSVGFVLVLVIVAPFVVYAVPQTVGADHSYIVLSGSMEPTLSPGDAVIVREAPPEDIEKQEIITFQREQSDTPTTHRVVGVEQEDGQRAFVTRGDANENRDPGAVAPSQVIGEVVLVIPFIGHVIQAVNSPLGLIALIGVPIGLLVVSELWNVARGTESATANKGTTTSGNDSSMQTASTEPSTAESNGFYITPSSLQLIISLLGLYVIYTWYIVTTRLEGLTVGVATATTVAFLYGLVLYHRHYNDGRIVPSAISQTDSAPAESTGDNTGTDPDDQKRP